MANPPHEPTMEEILASIRKIISEDSSAPVTAVPPSESRTGEAEVLELTQVVNETHSQSPPAPSVEVRSTPPDPDHAPTGHANAPEPAESDRIEAPAHPSVAEGLFSEKTRQVLSETLAALDAPVPAEPVSETAVPPVGVSVEAVFERAVRESFSPVLQKWLSDNSSTLVDRMTPTIRDWLDEHFPPMLEEAVRAELARAAKLRARR
jgi:cell pole-organizing protein PopZ